MLEKCRLYTHDIDTEMHVSVENIPSHQATSHIPPRAGGSAHAPPFGKYSIDVIVFCVYTSVARTCFIIWTSEKFTAQCHSPLLLSLFQNFAFYCNLATPLNPLVFFHIDQGHVAPILHCITCECMYVYIYILMIIHVYRYIYIHIYVNGI